MILKLKGSRLTQNNLSITVSKTYKCDRLIFEPKLLKAFYHSQNDAMN